MNFFDYIRNESFFRPLNLKYRRVYYDCIQILIDKAKEEHVPYVLKMELSNADIANAVAEAAGTGVKVLYSCHNLSADDFENGETYLSMMQKNVETLKEVLNGWR